MEALPPVLSSVLPLVGVILGAFLHAYFSRSSTAKKQLQELRIRAYTDYLRCVAENAAPKNLESDLKLPELLARIADSKTRIAVFGSSNVVKALSNFESHGPVIDSAEKELLFLEIAKQMRSEIPTNSDTIDSQHLKTILFGAERPRKRIAG